ncbi:MAG: hypothetical protein COW00_19870 [Bdellovibrio sp. CG12_big_fil_rev_8_21_14_0_65_39_13]|nr:MAG: hypothetical protein COW78_02045 [Bdellovibrio sp. CG22_combo_CG10-13_8_21_14_all_39_27]PIQ57633.1 MAG: hypothetical protein COW00_19870 [Bdellovibrio sp. CG12_big_fil_rev_8_21_14_0_65_39_13]PIR35797.1 MAG: hypothetical protein COV37_06250 [Bdellovibrio sp. CG11_big_fil_rev_8_21_14_0_20_39_38]
MSDENEIQFQRKILFVESSSAMRKLIANNLELYTGSEVICMKNSEELSEYFKSGESANLIVTEDMVDGEYTSLKVVYFVNAQQLEIPVIVMGQNPKLEGKAILIDRENWRGLVKEAAKLLEVTSEVMMEFSVPEYYPFQMACLLTMTKVPVDLYLDEEDGMNTWLLAESSIDREKVESLIFDGLQTFYVSRYHRLEFVNFLSTELYQLLSDPNLTFQNRVAVTQAAMDSSCYLIEQFGMDKKAIQTTRTAVESFFKMALLSPGLDDLLDVLSKNTNSYTYKHSLMISIFGHHLISKLQWGNTEQQKIIGLAAFFHDVMIADDRMTCIHSTQSLKESSLPDEQKIKVARHAFLTSELLSKYPDLPMGTDSVILQHHGTLNGIGFSDDHLDNRLSPLAIVFLVTEDFVHRILASEKPDKKAILHDMSLKYDKGQYRKCIEALEKAVS